MKVSFLLTYFNQEQYVDDSINSILSIEKQFEWELLIGDDGSSDGTVKMIEKYVERYPKHIKLFIIPKNNYEEYDPIKRASANRLFLLEQCSGDCFCILDGDDYYCDTRFVCDSIELFNKYSSISVVSFGYNYVRDNVKSNDITLPTTYNNSIVNKRDYIKNYYIPAGSCVHRLSWDRDRINYIKTLGYFDDNNIMFNSLNFGEMYFINRVIYSYRQRNNSTYNSMNQLQQAMINIQGMDVDAKLINKGYYRDLLIRNCKSYILMYIMKNNITKENKFNRLYMNNCKSIGDSTAYIIMNYSNENRKLKKHISLIFLYAFIHCPIYTIRVLLQKKRGHIR